MRIATWNCYRGDCLERAAELARFSAHVVVLQECSRAKSPKPNDTAVWFGDKPAHGVGVVTRGKFRVTAGPLDASFNHSAFPAVVSGPTPFNLLAVWAAPRPSYVRSMLGALEAYAEFLKSGPSVIVGDFNCFARWEGKAPSSHHVKLERRLREDFDLVSAYHVTRHYRKSKIEAPTHFWRWKEHHPFHIDYCFVPRAWVKAVRTVHVESFAAQGWRSDHRPVVVDLALAPGRRRRLHVESVAPQS